MYDKHKTLHDKYFRGSSTVLTSSARYARQVYMMWIRFYIQNSLSSAKAPWGNFTIGSGKVCRGRLWTTSLRSKHHKKVKAAGKRPLWRREYKSHLTLDHNLFTNKSKFHIINFTPCFRKETFLSISTTLTLFLKRHENVLSMIAGNKYTFIYSKINSLSKYLYQK